MFFPGPKTAFQFHDGISLACELQGHSRCQMAVLRGAVQDINFILPQARASVSQSKPIICFA